MPFGLSNSPAAFQCFMNNVFHNFLDKYITTYLNNILIYSDNLSKHQKNVHKVLCHLWKHDLYIHADKCKFSVDTVKYLGFILSLTGLCMSENKVKIIQDWPEPRKVKDIQSFLGFA